jgi:hypothetical protein
MPDLYNDFVFGSLTASVSISDTTATLDDVSTFPSNTLLAKADFYVAFDSTLTHPNAFEIVKVTNVNTSTKVITFTPAAASAHGISTMVKGTLTAGMLQRLRAGLSGTSVPAQDNTIYSVGDKFLLTTTNQLYVYTSTGFIPIATSRATATATTSSLAAGATDSSTTITLGKGYLLYSIQASKPARVRLYTTAAARTADLNRAIGVDPSSSAGVVLDYYATGAGTTYSLSPIVSGTNLESSPSTTISMSVTNMDTTTGTVTVTLVWLGVE